MFGLVDWLAVAIIDREIFYWECFLCVQVISVSKTDKKKQNFFFRTNKEEEIHEVSCKGTFSDTIKIWT